VHHRAQYLPAGRSRRHCGGVSVLDTRDARQLSEKRWVATLARRPRNPAAVLVPAPRKPSAARN
jgi:hypothetical protein